MPNPVASAFMVAFSNAGTHSIEITDLAGRLLFTTTCTGPKIILQKGTLHSGIYLLKATGDQKAETVKLIVE